MTFLTMLLTVVLQLHAAPNSFNWLVVKSYQDPGKLASAKILTGIERATGHLVIIIDHGKAAVRPSTVRKNHFDIFVYDALTFEPLEVEIQSTEGAFPDKKLNLKAMADALDPTLKSYLPLLQKELDEGQIAAEHLTKLKLVPAKINRGRYNGDHVMLGSVNAGEVAYVFDPKTFRQLKIKDLKSNLVAWCAALLAGHDLDQISFTPLADGRELRLAE